MATDATGILVLAKEVCRRVAFYVLVAARDHVLFGSVPKNDGDNVAALLAGFGGRPMLSDASSGGLAIADFTGSGHPEVLVQGNAAPPYIFPADPGHQSSPVDDPPNRLPVYHTDAGTQVGFDPTAIMRGGGRLWLCQ